MAEHWLAKEGGLKFKCTGCGNCCTATNGIVLVNREERQRIANRLGMPLDTFEEVFTWSYNGPDMRTIRTTPQGCALFDARTRKCTVYGDHPLQCRTFPFWVGKIKSEEAWNETCKQCEGCNHPEGKFYPRERIKMLAVGTMRLHEQPGMEE